MTHTHTQFVSFSVVVPDTESVQHLLSIDLNWITVLIFRIDISLLSRSHCVLVVDMTTLICGYEWLSRWSGEPTYKHEILVLLFSIIYILFCVKRSFFNWPLEISITTGAGSILWNPSGFRLNWYVDCNCMLIVTSCNNHWLFYFSTLFVICRHLVGFSLNKYAKVGLKDHRNKIRNHWPIEIN